MEALREVNSGEVSVRGFVQLCIKNRIIMQMRDAGLCRVILKLLSVTASSETADSCVRSDRSKRFRTVIVI